MADTELDARLRGIIVDHTVLGGYPDTMGIARAAYALALAQGGAAAVADAMTLERTVWHGSSKDDETVAMDAWITEAAHADLDRLLVDPLDVASARDQDFLATVWHDCAEASGRRAVMHEDADLVTYHWREGDRLSLRRAVATLRPGHLKSDPNQGSLI